MEEIGKILPAVLKRHMGRENTRVAEILGPLWSRVAGKAIGYHSRPVAFARGTLTVATPCLAWAGQLQHMTEEIRAEINSCLGAPLVKKLRVRYEPEFHWEPQDSKLEGRGLKPIRSEQNPDFRDPNFELGVDLDPEVARVVSRSFAKYFARRQAEMC